MWSFEGNVCSCLWRDFSAIGGNLLKMKPIDPRMRRACLSPPLPPWSGRSAGRKQYPTELANRRKREVNAIARLSEIIAYKNKMIDLLLTDAELCQALYYSEPAFREQPVLSDPNVLRGSRIYPYSWLPGAAAEPGTYLTVAAGGCESAQGAYKSGLIAVRIFTHESLQLTAYDYTRVDFIMSRTDALANGASGFGIGKLRFHDMKELVVGRLRVPDMEELVVQADYQGATLQYRAVDYD